MALRIAQTGLVAVALVAAWLPVPPAAVERWFSNGWYPAPSDTLRAAATLYWSGVSSQEVMGSAGECTR